MLASLLLVASLVGLAVPFLEAQTSIPACCRRNGHHRCAAPAPEDAFRSSAACCSYRHLIPLVSHGATVLGSTGGTFLLISASQPFLPSDSLHLVARVTGNAQKRGPPSA